MTTRALSACVLLVAPAGVTAQAPQPLWTNTFGAIPNTIANAAAADGTGAVFVAGLVFGDPNGLYGPPLGGGDAFVARFAPSGALVWGRQFAGPEHEGASGVCADGSGAAFVVGTVTVSPTTHPFIARFDTAGTQLWYRLFGSTASDGPKGVCTDGAGGAYVWGGTYGSLGGPNAGGNDAFVARYDAAGNQLWVRQIGTTENDECSAGCADGAGGVLIGGGTGGLLGQTNFGQGDAWVARYDREGNRQWTRQFGTQTAEALSAMCSDGTGGIYAVGGTYGSLGGPSAGNSDGFLLRLTMSGETIWARQFGSNSADTPRSMAPDGAGGVYITGETFGSLGGPYRGQGDVFLAQYSSSGQQLWITQSGTAQPDRAYGIAPDASGGVYVTGASYNIQPGVTLATLARYPGPCYPNCDHSTAAPALNILDFNCFVNRYTAGDSYANCDGSTVPPSLNILDFNCFVNRFTEGCP